MALNDYLFDDYSGSFILNEKSDDSVSLISGLSVEKSKIKFESLYPLSDIVKINLSFNFDINKNNIDFPLMNNITTTTIAINPMHPTTIPIVAPFDNLLFLFFMHFDDPSSEYVPSGHFVHSDDPSSEYVPVEHNLHVPYSLAFAYAPA